MLSKKKESHCVPISMGMRLFGEGIGKQAIKRFSLSRRSSSVAHILPRSSPFLPLRRRSSSVVVPKSDEGRIKTRAKLSNLISQWM